MIVPLFALANAGVRVDAETLRAAARYPITIGVGIGFTVALFITDLAFDDPALREQAVVGVLTGSLLAAALGWSVFHFLGERGGVCAPPGEEIDPVPTLPPRPWYEPAEPAPSLAPIVATAHGGHGA